MAGQLGHTDAKFSLNVYVQAVKRRERLTGNERKQYDAAIEWAQWAATGSEAVETTDTEGMKHAA